MAQTEKPPAEKIKNNRLHTKRRWIPYAGAALLIVLIVAGLWPRPALVETAQATLGPLRVTVNEEGKTRLRQRYIVSTPLAGQLRRIPFKAGAQVEAGKTVVAVIDPLPPVLLDDRSRDLAQARVATAAANVEKARATLQFAQSEWQRIEKLFTEQTVSKQEFEQAQWRHTAALKELAASQSALREAQAQLAEYPLIPNRPPATPNPIELTAPVTGRVLRVFEESARTVGAGTPLVELGDPYDLEAVIEVLSRDGAAIQPGNKVELDQWGGPTPLQARVRLVEPSAFLKISALGVEEQRVNVIADIITPPPQRPTLGDSFRVEARVIIWETNQTLKLPSGALFRTGQDWATFLVSNGRARLQKVRTGRSSGAETEVLSGLNAGDQVIVYPGDRIRNGIRIKPMFL